MYKITSKDIDAGESANCVWVYVWILGWPYVFIVSKKAIYKGTELVLDYNLESYWVAMERIIKDHQLVSGLQTQASTNTATGSTTVKKGKNRVVSSDDDDRPVAIDDAVLMKMRKNVASLGAMLWNIESAPESDPRWKEGQKKLTESISMLEPFLGGSKPPVLGGSRAPVKNTISNGASSDSSCNLQIARERMSAPIVIGIFRCG
jgi:hypothetical protein